MLDMGGSSVVEFHYESDLRGNIIIREGSNICNGSKMHQMSNPTVLLHYFYYMHIICIAGLKQYSRIDLSAQ